MTQPEHPFTNLPEGALVENDRENWVVKNGDTEVWIEPYVLGGYCATFDFYESWHRGPTPDAAFQALRQAVRELAHDLGVG